MKDNALKFIKKNYIYILLFFTFLIMLSAFKNTVYFTDEGDNYLAGMALNNGLKIYKGFYSQHLPGMYFISAVLYKLGLHTTISLRFGCYTLLSLIWVFTIVRYSKHLNKKALILYPFIYISIMCVGTLTNSIVADQFQAQFLYILLLEFLMFLKEDKMSLSSMIIISLSMFWTITCSAISLYPVGIFVLGMLFVDIKRYIQKNNRFNPIKYIIEFFKKYYLLLIICIIPWVIFILYLYLTGTLKACYDQAVYLNTDVYSKYTGMNGGLIDTYINTLFGYPSYILGLINQALTFQNIIPTVVLLTLNIFVILELIKKVVNKKYEYIALYPFLASNGSRDFQGFHAMAFQAILIALFVFAFVKKIDTMKYKTNFYILIIGLIMTPYLPYAAQIKDKPTEIPDFKLVKEFIGDDDKILLLNLDTHGYLNSKLLPASRMYSLVPWFADIYEDEIIEDVANSQVKLIRFSPEIDIWGMKMKNFAPKFTEFVMNNYTYTSYDDMWVRNDLVSEFEEKFNIDIPDETNAYFEKLDLKELKNDIIVEQYLTNAKNIKRFEIYFETNERTNYNTINIQILNEDREIVYNENIEAQYIADKSFYTLNIPKINENDIYIKLQSEDADENNFVKIYKTNEEMNEADKLTINNHEVPGQLFIKAYNN